MSNVEQAADTGNLIDIVVNGSPRRLPQGSTLLTVLEVLKLDPSRVAIERNRAIVKRPLWQDTQIGPNDQLEIVQFVGGG